MSPETPIFGRITIGANRVSLGRGGYSVLFLRAQEQIKKLRVGDDTVIQIEMCRNRLEDSTTFNRTAILEHEFNAQLSKTSPDDDSPYPGLKMSRVLEVIDSPEYERYQFICQPDNRMGLSQADLDQIISAYQTKFPDCAPHFPGWVD